MRCEKLIECCLRPQDSESTASRPICEVNQSTALLVLRWGTTQESMGAAVNSFLFLFFQPPPTLGQGDFHGGELHGIFISIYLFFSCCLVLVVLQGRSNFMVPTTHSIEIISWRLISWLFHFISSSSYETMQIPLVGQVRIEKGAGHWSPFIFCHSVRKCEIAKLGPPRYLLGSEDLFSLCFQSPRYHQIGIESFATESLHFVPPSKKV